MLEHVVFEWRDALDILLVAFLLYQVIQLLRGSRALTVLTGLGLLTLLYFISRSMSSAPCSCSSWSFSRATSGRHWAR